MIGTAYAQAAGGAAGNEFLSLLPMIGIFVVFYFLLIRPQQKRAKAHKAMLAELKRGDHVITSAGLIGRILEIDDEQVLLESGESKLRVTRGAIGGLVPGKGGKDDSK